VHRFGSLAISVAVVGSGMTADAAPVVADVVAPTTIDGCTRLISADTIKRVSGVTATHIAGPEAFGDTRSCRRAVTVRRLVDRPARVGP